MSTVPCENINPYSSGDGTDKTSQVRAMFNNIAPAYDFMNKAMTLGIDRLWRRKAVKMIARERPRHVLDVATGTGDMAINLARHCSAGIIGIDLSAGMIDVGRHKVAEAGLDSRVSFKLGDCLDLPFEDNSFDCISVAFGVRNFEHLSQGYENMLRVLRPGGMLLVLELSTPASPLVRPFYNIYTRYLIPFVGKMVSHDAQAYTYLPKSIAAVPQRLDMTSLMERAGFVDTHYESLTLGVCTLYTARKPDYKKQIIK